MTSTTFQGPVEGRYVSAGNNFFDDAAAHYYFPPERPETPPHPSSSVIPFRRDEKFVQRGDLLDKIHELCAKPAGRAALVGLGGVGKSQLAIEFAHQFKARNAIAGTQKWLFWVHASSAPRIEQGFKAIAEIIKIPNRNKQDINIMQLVYDKLSNENWGKWCMILDSCDEHDILFSEGKDGRSLATYLPQSQNGSILATTRNRDIAYRLTGEFQAILPLGCMAQTEAIRLLENRLGFLPDANTALELTKALEFFPLAVSQAAAYIRAQQPLMSLEEYISEFREGENQRTRLLNQDSGDLRREGGASNAVLITWQLSFQCIRAKRPSAADLLSLMSFFNPQGIPKWLLERFGGDADVTQTVSVDRTETNDLRVLATLRDDISILRNYFLVNVTEKGDAFEMHGLVQLSAKQWLKENGLQESFEGQYLKLLAKYFPTGKLENWKVCRELFPHVEAILEHWSQCPLGNMLWAEDLATLSYHGGWYSLEIGKLDTAERMLDISITMREKRLGRESTDDSSTISLLADVYRQQQRWDGAKKLYLEALEVDKRMLGIDHPDTLHGMYNLVRIFRHQKRYNEAENLALEVLEIQKNSKRANMELTHKINGCLGALYSRQGQYDRAERVQREVYEFFQHMYGPDNPKTLAAMKSLSGTLRRGGKKEEALEMMEKCNQARQRVLGMHHPDTRKAHKIVEEWRQETIMG